MSGKKAGAGKDESEQQANVDRDKKPSRETDQKG
jgi:hypothetical protein